MNYSLASTRKIGDYIQQIIVQWNNHQGLQVRDKMRGWTIEFYGMNPSGRELGDLVIDSFSVKDNVGKVIGENQGTLADIDLCVLCTATNTQKYTTFTVKDVSQENIKSKVKGALLAKVVRDYEDSSVYIVSAIIRLHD